MTTPSPRVKGWNGAGERWWAEIKPLLAASAFYIVLRGVGCVL